MAGTTILSGLDTPGLDIPGSGTPGFNPGFYFLMAAPPQPPPTTIWQYKPWWCQPWSILLTGVSIIAASWVVFHLFWLTLLVAVPILVWMGYFLLVYPRFMQQSGGLGESVQQPDPAQNSN